MKRWLDRIDIWYVGFPGISGDLVNFQNESVEYKMADELTTDILK